MVDWEGAVFQRTIQSMRRRGSLARSVAYLQPASLMRLAYILPMSPIPMMPTTASPMLAASTRPQHVRGAVRSGSKMTALR